MDYLEHLYSFVGRIFSENMADNVLSNIIAGLILTSAGILIGFRVHIYKLLKARMLRHYSGDGIGIAICDMAGDEQGIVRKLIAANLELNYRKFIGAGSEQNLHVIFFPLSLSSGTTEKSRLRAEKKARRWLRRLGCDVIVWGESVDKRTLSLMRFVDRHTDLTGRALPQQLDVGAAAGRFNEFLAEAVAFEIAALTSKVYSQPENVDIDTLRRASRGVAPLLESGMPGLSEANADKIRKSFDDIQLELSRRATDVSDWKYAVENARKRLSKVNKEQNPLDWAGCALRYSIHVRRQAFAGVESGKLRHCFELLQGAKEVFAASSFEDKASECFEQMLWLEYWCRHADGLTIFPEAVPEALKRVSQNKNHKARNGVLAFLCAYRIDTYKEVMSSTEINENWASRNWDALGSFSLEPTIASEVLRSLSSEQFDEADWTRNEKLWINLEYFLQYLSEAFPVRSTLLDACVAWTALSKYDLLYVDGRLNGSASQTMARLVPLRERAKGHLENVSPNDAPRIRMFLLLAWANSANSIGRHHPTDETFEEAVECASEALEISARLYPARRKEVLRTLARTLNNWSHFLSKVQPARRAIAILKPEVQDSRSYEHYILAYSYWTLADKLCRVLNSQQASEIEIAEIRDALDASIAMCVAGQASGTNQTLTENYRRLNAQATETKSKYSHILSRGLNLQ